MAVRNGVFREYVATYVDAISGVRYRELEELQPPPFAGLARGGAGTAYVLARLGQRRRAQSWLAAALADRRASAYRWREGAAGAQHFTDGRLGLQWVRALLGDSEAFVRALRTTDRNIDLYGGAAGRLTAVRIATRRDPHLARHGVAIARALARRTRPHAARWVAADASRLGHGWAGVIHALVSWHHSRGEPLPPWLATGLRHLAEVWTQDALPPRAFRESCCNGAAGALLLWARAFEHTSDEIFLDRARVAADAAIAGTNQQAHLCCGDGGVAFALLALHRIDPSGPWRDRARDRAARAIGSALVWPNGLFWGHPGLVCLALDLEAERPAGFPAIDA